MVTSSGGSSPFLESPMPASPKLGPQLDRQVMTLQYKLNTMQNEFEIERLRLQQQSNMLDKKYRNSVEELEKALDDTKFLYETNGRLEEELTELKKKVKETDDNREDELHRINNELRTKEYQLNETETEYRSKISGLETQLENDKVQWRSSQTLLKRYEEEITNQSNQIKALRKNNSEKEDELANLRASRVVGQHHNNSTEEIQELTVTNKMLQDQLEYARELEEANMQQARELKRLRKVNESQNFWKNENEKLQNKVEDLNLLEKQFQDSQLENVQLKSQLASWGICTDETKSKKPEDIIRDWTVTKKECIVLSDENRRINLELVNLKSLNDELALERNQLLGLNKSLESSIVNLKKLNHEVEQQKQLSFEECRLLRIEMNEFSRLSKDPKKESDGETEARYGSLVNSYKNQTEDLTGELKRLNDQLLSREPSANKKRKASDQLGLNYSQRLNELQLENVNLTRELHKCGDTIIILEDKIKSLTELKEKKIRILQLRDNPLLKDQFVKKKHLDLLKQENADLLQNRKTEGLPISVYESLKYEIKQQEEELFRANKKFIRLKQMFNKKSLEFIDVVNSLLGFRLEFQQDGKVKIISCFKPERSLLVDLNQNTLKSNLDRDIPDWENLLHCWVDQRGQIPCFLATITLRLWENSPVAGDQD